MDSKNWFSNALQWQTVALITINNFLKELLILKALAVFKPPLKMRGLALNFLPAMYKNFLRFIAKWNDL